MSKAKKCMYCGTGISRGDMCTNCREKKKLVHKIWLIGQELKKRDGVSDGKV